MKRLVALLERRHRRATIRWTVIQPRQCVIARKAKP